MNNFSFQLLCAFVLTFLFATSARSEIIERVSSVDYLTVNSALLDKHAREESYKAVLVAAFPALKVDSLRLKDEYAYSEGKVISFRQYQYGLPIQGSVAWLRLNNGDSVLYAGIRIYENLDLTFEPFLSYIGDQDSLIAIANRFCTYCDSITAVEPYIQVESDTSGWLDQYRYVVILYENVPAPGTLYDLQTGDSIGTLKRWGETVHGALPIKWKNHVDTDGPSPGETQSLAFSAIGNTVRSEWFIGNQSNWHTVPSWDGDFGGLIAEAGDNNQWRIRAYYDSPNIRVYLDGAIFTKMRQFYEAPSSDETYSVNFNQPQDIPVTSPYYHVVRAISTLQLGTDYFPDINVLSSEQTGSNTFQSGFDRATIELGEQYGRNWSEYRDVVLHEFAHVLQLRSYGQGGISPGHNQEGLAVAEGLGYFYAALQGLELYSGTSILLWPSSTGPAIRNVDTTLTYEDYQMGDAHSYGRLFSSALWSFGRNYEYMRGLLGAVHVLQPVEMPAWAYSLALVMDDDHQLCNGWPNGQALYRAFWEEHHIPSRPTWNSAEDGWEYYRNVALSSRDVFALETSGTNNITQGNVGNYVVYRTDGRIFLGNQGTELNAPWGSHEVGESFVQKSSVSVDVDHLELNDQLFLSWSESDETGIYVKYCRSEVLELGECGVTLSEAQLIQSIGASEACPSPAAFTTIVTHPAGPTVFDGFSDCSIPFLGYGISNNGGESIQWGYMLDETSGHEIDALAAFAEEGSNVVHLVWIMDNQVFYKLGDRGGWGADYNWLPTQNMTPGNSATKQNVSVAYSPDIEAVVVAWDELNSSTDNWELRTRKGRAVNGTQNPLFSAAETISFGACGDLKAPCLSPFFENDWDVPPGYTRIGLAYEQYRDLNGVPATIPSVQLRGLMVTDETAPNDLDPTTWQWMQPIWIGRGFGPSICSAGGNGYSILYVDGEGNPEHDIVLASRQIWYSPAVETADPILVTSVDTVFAPTYLTSSLVVEPGGSLVISSYGCSESVITVGPDVSITVKGSGSLKVVGASSKLIEFGTPNASGTWSGITVEPGGSLFMDYVEMKDCSVTCVKATSPAAVEINHCTFRGNKMGSNQAVVRLEGSPAITQIIRESTITEVPYGLGLYASTCDLDVEKTTIENCGYGNSYIKSVTGSFRECTFRGQGTAHGVCFQSGGNTPNFQCCTFENLVSPSGTGVGGSTVNAYGLSSPSFGYSTGPYGASNVFNDDSWTLLRMIGSGVKPIISNPPSSNSPVGGANDWTQRKPTGYYIYWLGTGGSDYWAKRQWWDRKPLKLDDFYPDSTFFVLGDEPASAWELCAVPVSSVVERLPGREARLDDVPSIYDSLFAVAMGHEIERDYTLSQPLFRQIAAECGDYGMSWQAMVHAAANQRFLGGQSDGDWIPLLIDSLVSTAPSGQEYEATVTGERIKGNLYLTTGDFTTAISTLADLLESGLTEEDSLYACIDLLTVYSLAGLDSTGGSLDNVGIVNRVPPALRISTSEEAWQVEQDLVARLNALDGGTVPQETPAIPTEYKLYQNYPNPFNPTTQIEYDLPEAAHVTLKVFNTLGQEVAVVKDAMMLAGHHVATWDGKSNVDAEVATGLYIYQLKTGSFTDSKKMVLMR